MSSPPDPTQRLLDEIDSLVDESLAGGDQSAEYSEPLRDSCPYCDYGWHGLAITGHMQQMQRGSYGRDEFGYGIMDPDYKHSEDRSPILCPGSEYKGPPIGNREWGWYLRHTGRRPAPVRQQAVRAPDPYNPYPGPLRVWKMIGPWSSWEVAMNFEHDYPDQITSTPGATRLKMKLTFKEPLRNLTTQWIIDHADQVEYWWRDSREGICAKLRPIEFYYDHVEIFTLPGEEQPHHLEISTAYPLEIHRWAQGWFIPPRPHYTTPALHLIRQHQDQIWRRQYLSDWTISADDHRQLPPPPWRPPRRDISFGVELSGTASNPSYAVTSRGPEADIVIIDEAYEFRQPSEEQARHDRNTARAQAAATRQAAIQVQWRSPVLPGREGDAPSQH